MDIGNLLPNSGINSILIIDDDTTIFYDEISFINYGISQSIIDKLNDDDDPSTIQLIKVLQENDLDYALISDRIKAFNNPDLINYIPKYYVENIIKPLKDKHDSLYYRIKTVRNCLLKLGALEGNISEVGTSTEAIENIKSNSYDLIILDLMLKDEEKSLPLLKKIIDIDKLSSTQIILTSYRTDELKSDYRKIHIENGISSSKLKVLNKPDIDINSNVTWHHALIQICHERQFMCELQTCQDDWVESIDIVSSKLKEKIWTLDSCYINKLRITAEEDDLSFSDYLTELICKHMVSEYESSQLPIRKIDDLADKIKNTDNSDFIFGYSLEAIDPYENLKIMISDFTSYRANSLLSLPMTKDKDGFETLLSAIKFGSILKSNEGDYLVHVTPPCDYIHLNFKNRNKENFLFFPGKEYEIHKGEGKNDKVYQTPYVNIEGKVKHLRWNLRAPTSYKMGTFLDNCQNFSIVGQLRNDYAQAIIHKFTSAASRIATARLPIFDNGLAYHLSFDKSKPVNGYSISTLQDSMEIDRFKDIKMNGILEKQNGMLVRKFKSNNKVKIIFPSESASRISKLSSNSHGSILEEDVCIEMMFGIDLDNTSIYRADSGLLFISSSYYSTNSKEMESIVLKEVENKNVVNFIIIDI